MEQWIAGLLWQPPSLKPFFQLQVQFICQQALRDAVKAVRQHTERRGKEK